jgi:hypothetical protein
MRNSQIIWKGTNMSKHNDLFYEIVGEPEKNEQEYTMMLDFIDANPDYSEEELR